MLKIAYAQGLTSFIKEYCREDYLGYYPEALQSCIQGIYNLLVALAVLVAFLYFLFGAIQYMLSPIADIKGSGKSKMFGALKGLFVIFMFGAILYWVNPNIFNAKLIFFRVTSLEILLENVDIGTEVSGLPQIEGTGKNPSQSGIQYGKPLIKQGDPLWANHPYRNPKCGSPNQTIGSSGCGIASLAMAIAYYNNYQPNQYHSLITQLADAVVNKGYRTCNQGTAHALYGDNNFLGQWGVKGTPIGKKINAAIDAVEQGKIVIAAMSGPSMFTKQGHYITLVGFSNNKFLINDPGPRDVRKASKDDVQSAVVAMWIIDKK